MDGSDDSESDDDGGENQSRVASLSPTSAVVGMVAVLVCICTYMHTYMHPYICSYVFITKQYMCVYEFERCTFPCFTVLCLQSFPHTRK